MARGFSMTALRSALGGIGGAFEGIGADREARRLEEQQRQALERQRMLDRAMLQREGYEETSAMDQMRAGGRDAVFRTVFGPPAQRQPGDARAVAAALESNLPRQTMTLDGTRFERTSPRALELRQAEQEQMRERNKALTAQQTRDAEQAAEVDAMVAAGIPRARAAVAARRGAKYGDLFMTPGDLARQKTDLAQLGISRERLKLERGGGKIDPLQLRVRSGMNEMLIADQGMNDFEKKFLKGEVQITVGQQVLRKLASDFATEKTPLDKIVTSASYKALAQKNPELVEYMRNVDAFAEGESMITSRPSNFRTKMAQFLSGIAAGSPQEVVSRVQQRRRGLLTPMVDAYAGGSWDQAMQEAVGEATGQTEGTSGAQAQEAVAPAQQKASVSIREWMDANPQRSGESDQAYIARGKAATGGR